MSRRPEWILLCALLLGACNVGSYARVNPNTVVSYGVPDSGRRAVAPRGSTTNLDCPFTSGLDDTTTGAINLDCFRFPDDSSDGPTAYQRAAAVPPGGSDDRIYARNRLAGILVKHADDVCVLEKGRIVGREGALNFGLGGATTALSTVATIVGGETAKSILSGAAAFTSGVRGHAAESFYRNQVTQAINAAMDGEREKVRGEIEKGRKETIANFTVDDMIRLVNQYHHACSYERGLQLLVKAAVNQEGFNSIAANRTAAAEMATLAFERDAAQRAATQAKTDDERKLQLDRVKQLNESIDAKLGRAAGSASSSGGDSGTATGEAGGTGGGEGANPPSQPVPDPDEDQAATKRETAQ